MEKLLTDKVAIVTGASRGIGRQIAMTLAQEGAYVIVNYNGSKEAAEAVVETITAAGGQAETWQCSVADFAAVEEMIKSIYKKFGHIDVLVNNAGITKDNLLMKMKEEEFDAVIDTNLKGSFNTMRHVARYMLKQKSGSIINISSVSGVLGNPGQMNYCASKAGVIGHVACKIIIAKDNIRWLAILIRDEQAYESAAVICDRKFDGVIF